jgi:hypothetical protein
MLEGKNEWMNSIYKELEISLEETNEELLKAQIQIINYRLCADGFE